MPTISNNDIAKAIYSASKDNVPSAQIVKFLARRRLLSKSSAILAELKKVVSRDTGTIEAKISSVGGISEKTKKEITQFLIKRFGSKGVMIHENLDKELIGGYKIEAGDEIIDFTWKNRITKLKEYLTTSHEH